MLIEYIEITEKLLVGNWKRSVGNGQKAVGKRLNLELAEETNVIDGLTWSFIA